MSLKGELHDRLWHAYERWHEMREQGATKHDLNKCDFKAFMDRGIVAGLAAKTLKTMSSALAKFGALTGQTKSFASQGLGWPNRRTSRLPSRRFDPMGNERSWNKRHGTSDR